VPQRNLRPGGWAQDARVNQVLEYPADERYAVIVSHDCEFNEAKRPHFLVARLEDFNPRTSSEQRGAIRAANDAVREVGGTLAERFDYLDTFVFDPLDGCFEEAKLVRFTTITAIPDSMKQTIYDVKRAELEHDDRVRLRKKLAFFFGRDADDVPAEDKRDRPAVASEGQASAS
jgi:hypothetical protein